jgi:hypothetical protein
MTVYLALKHKLPSEMSPRFFAKVIRARLVSTYYHGGIVIDDMLYESTFEKGVSSRPFVPEGWDLYELTNLNAQDVLQRFTSVLHRPYDWFSLLAFVLPWRASVSQWFYCFELCWYLIHGTSPNHRVTPENLLIGVFNANKNRPVGMVH